MQFFFSNGEDSRVTVLLLVGLDKSSSHKKDFEATAFEKNETKTETTNKMLSNSRNTLFSLPFFKMALRALR